MSDTFEPNELYRFENVVFDVARQYGNESQLSRDRIGRIVNRAAVLVAGDDRDWSWMHVIDTFTTATGVEEYTLNADVRDILQMWKTGSNRGPIDRIGPKQFRRFVPDTTVYNGVPRMWDDRGVDSSGSKIISLFPIPSGAYTINYQYFKHITPIRNNQVDVRSWWGMPPNVIECVIQMATALTFKGMDDARYKAERAEAEAMVQNAFMADQRKGATVIRVPSEDPDNAFSDGPMLPPTWGN